jgi:Na+/melibiose symporter-like transporter
MIRANSLRLFTGSIGAIVSVVIVALLTPPLYDSKYRLLISGSIVAVLLMIFHLSFVFVTRENSKPAEHHHHPSEETLQEITSRENVLKNRTTLIRDTKHLFSLKPFLFLVFSHFWLWAMTICIHAAIPAYVREYLRYDNEL